MRRSAPIVAVILAVAGTARGEVIIVGLDALTLNDGDEANVGVSLRPFDAWGEPAPVLVTARTRVDPARPFDFHAVGEAGTIYVNDEGLGVQDSEGSGSKGISGGGGHQNEEIVFGFDTLVHATSIRIGIADFDPGVDLDKDDDLVLFVELDGGAMLFLDEFDYMDAFVPADGIDDAGFIDFGLLGGAVLGDGALVQSITVRETHGHTLVNAVAFAPVPGPAGLALLAAFGLRRRRRAG